jgi:hypothetical protein
VRQARGRVGVVAAAPEERAPHSETNRDYFAELYVAGYFGDAGWCVYFPKRDVGFDFVASKRVRNTIILRPVQVKGKYPTRTKKDQSTYGHRGRLSALHDGMVLVIPYFAACERGAAPEEIAFMPRSELRPRTRGGYSCVPASFAKGHARPRKGFRQFFGPAGLRRVERRDWGKSGTTAYS